MHQLTPQFHQMFSLSRVPFPFHQKYIPPTILRTYFNNLVGNVYRLTRHTHKWTHPELIHRCSDSPIHTHLIKTPGWSKRTSHQRQTSRQDVLSVCCDIQFATACTLNYGDINGPNSPPTLINPHNS